MFGRRLAEYLNSCGISGITAFAETMPAAKDLTPQYVGVFSSGDSDFRRTQFNSIKRFVVSGSASTAMSKALEIFLHFCPYKEQADRRFLVNEYYIMQAIPQGEPQLAENQGNIFLATFSISFSVARDS